MQQALAARTRELGSGIAVTWMTPTRSSVANSSPTPEESDKDVPEGMNEICTSPPGALEATEYKIRPRPKTSPGLTVMLRNVNSVSDAVKLVLGKESSDSVNPGSTEAPPVPSK